MPGFLELRETEARWRRFGGMERLEPADGRFALTFDDGPDPDCTPEVLDALDAAGARATFFCVGEQVEAHPELARELARRGHRVGLHGHRHVEHDTLDDPAGDLEHCRAALVAAGALEEAAGGLPTRPPYGRFSAASHAACLQAGHHPVLWSAWACDWEDIGAQRMADLVARDLDAGAIVLLHDSARYAYRPSACSTAAAVPLILAAASERGLSPALT